MKKLLVVISFLLVLLLVMTSCGNSTNTETTASGNSESTESSAIDSNITDNDESTNVEITSDVLSDSETEKDSSETSSEITIDSDTTADTETELGSSEDVTTTETESDKKTEEETEDPRLSEEYAPVLYFSGKDIYNIASEYIDGWKTGAGYLDDCQLLDNGKTARLITNTANIEAFLPLLTSPAEAAPYIAIKYRTNTPNILLQVFADSEYLSVQGGSVCDFSVSSSGRWETTVIDLTSKIAKFDGEIVNYIRFDFLNSPSKNLKEGDYMDIEYIGFFKSEADFAKFEGIKTKYDYSLNDPTSGYELYNLVYGAHIDSASATLDGNAVKNMNPGVSANSKDNRFLISVNANADTIDMKGWAVVDGGIAGYKRSADGGKTWHDAYLVGGVKEYVYSVDGGKTWYKVVNLSKGTASDGHYQAITRYFPEMANDEEHNVITTVGGAVLFDTRTGTGNGVVVNQAQAVANAVAAGDIASTTSSFTLMLGVVPIENDTAIVPMVQFINVKLP